jgi:hypothetical protein
MLEAKENQKTTEEINNVSQSTETRKLNKRKNSSTARSIYDDSFLYNRCNRIVASEKKVRNEDHK